MKKIFEFLKKLINAFITLVKWSVAVIAQYGVWNCIHASIRPWLWKLTGVSIKGKIIIGYDVYYDVNNASHIIIEDKACVTSRCLLLCHRRDMREYCKGDDVNKLPYIISDVHICKGVHVGMGSIIMPGVTIGEGAVIGAGSVVVKDIPAWTIAVGNPCKVIKEIKHWEQ